MSFRQGSFSLGLLSLILGVADARATRFDRQPGEETSAFSRRVFGHSSILSRELNRAGHNPKRALSVEWLKNRKLRILLGSGPTEDAKLAIKKPLEPPRDELRSSQAAPRSRSVGAPPGRTPNPRDPEDPYSGSPGDWSGPALDEHQKRRSREWERLGPQRWEEALLPKKSQHSSTWGIDNRSVVQRFRAVGFELEGFVSTERLEPVGELVAGRNETSHFTLGDQVLLESNRPGSLQVGEKYLISSEPVEMKSEGRRGFSYTRSGAVRIVARQGEKYIAEVLSNLHVLSRGMEVHPWQGKIRLPEPVAGPAPLRGNVSLDRRYSSYATTQHKLVIIDRGNEDGVQVGQIFRAYQYEDPGTGKVITDENFLVAADVQIVQVSPQFSVGVILRSRDLMLDGAEVILLQDLADLKRDRWIAPGPASQDLVEPVLVDPSTDAPDTLEEPAVDDLDQLDAGDGLTPEEAKELEQLERTDGSSTPDLSVPTADPEGTPTEGLEYGPPAPPPAPKTTPSPNPDTFPAEEIEPIPAGPPVPEEIPLEPPAAPSPTPRSILPPPPSPGTPAQPPQAPEAAPPPPDLLMPEEE